jgi:hypothetical protein
MAAVLKVYVVKIRDKYQNSVSRIGWLRRLGIYVNSNSASTRAGFGSVQTLLMGKIPR